MKLADKIVVVTGAGSGIGRQLALGLAARGATVVGIDYDESSLLETEQLVLARGGSMSGHVADLSNSSEIEGLPRTVLDVHGVVDGLINNAGIIHAHDGLAQLPQEQVRRVFDVNWWGTYCTVKAFLPALAQRDEAFICNVSSMGGYMPFPGQVAYGASKAAVKLFSEGLRVELKRDTGIRVSVVYPGAVDTGITENAPDISSEFKREIKSRTEGKQVGLSAARAAQIILRGIERNRSRIIVGTDSWIIDKMYRLLPTATTSLLAWLMEKFVGDGYDGFSSVQEKG